MKDLKNLVKSWPDSGLTQQKYYKKHKLSYNRFQYLYRGKSTRLSHEKVQGRGFMELSSAVLKDGEFRFTIYFPTGTRIECQGVPDVTFLKALLMP